MRLQLAEFVGQSLGPVKSNKLSDKHIFNRSWRFSIKLHRKNCHTHFPNQSPNSLAWVFHVFLLKLLDEFWCTGVIRTSSLFITAIHRPIVSVAALHITSYCFHVVQRELSYLYVCSILMPGTNHPEADYHFPIFRWLRAVHIS